jgi:4-hydroxy-tetrahydrodipicolinate synthase
MASEVKHIPFASVHPVLQIPFADSAEQTILHDRLSILAQKVLDFGAAGVVVLGLASEAWTLTERERDEVCATVAEAIGNRVPFTVGVEGSTTVAVERSRRAVALGASALMVLPSSSARKGQQLIAHFMRVVEAAEVPVLIQDFPQVTGIDLDTDVLIHMAQNQPLLRSVKVEAPGAGEKISRLVEAGIGVVTGWGGLHYIEAVQRGAVGCMPGAHLCSVIIEIDRLARRQQLDAAEQLYQVILPFLAYTSQSLDLLILAAKRWFWRVGLFPSGAMRQPARTMDVHEQRTIDRLYDQLQEARILRW